MTTRYGSILLYSSLQFSGNIEKYFVRHTKKLVIFKVLPRFNNPQSIVRIYQKGKKMVEYKVSSSSNIMMYYFLWYKEYMHLLLTYFEKNEEIFVISFHPLSFFFSSLQKLIRNVKFVFWVGDYFTGYKPTNFLFRIASQFYNKRLKYRLYLSDRLNEALNGYTIKTRNVKTVMWGIDSEYARKVLRKSPCGNCILGFSGMLRKSQGIEELLEALKNLPNVSLKLLGPAPNELYHEYKKIIKNNDLSKRVYFPNITVYSERLREMLDDCHIGIAMYDVSEQSATFYADPAKVKTYAEFGLPIIMTNAACIAEYIIKYHAGIVINQTTKDLSEAIKTISENYTYYKNGLSDFNNFFEYESYYKKHFLFLEKHEIK